MNVRRFSRLGLVDVRENLMELIAGPEHVTETLVQEITSKSTSIVCPSKITRYGWIEIASCTNFAPTIDFTYNVPMPSSAPKTVVFNNRKAMYPCLNPHLLREHGQVLSFYKAPFLPVAWSLPSPTPKPDFITTSPSCT
ncbi:hypothetical protein ARMGADRAFT_1089279 [Armillaria gallica]|uniref:Uncharacterized protein n=1 Tax=Armillaria gallica TaxID=47427 RepID=A0A2H3D337_ARMGA|nr:hypothetical protein ARMGADRAFT_1089279 [Armillaria gallica]